MSDNLLADNSLVTLAKQGDDDATEQLMLRHCDLVKTVAHSFYLVGADYDDLLQVGMIALFRAVSKYKTDGGSSFKTFAARCVRNAMLDAIATSKTNKNAALNESISLSSPACEDNGALATALASNEDNPESRLINEESESALYTAISNALDDDETDVSIVKLYLASMPYKAIAEELNVTAKHVDYTVSKLKKKLEKYVNDVK